METLEQTLKELEAREKSQHNLESIYVKELFPSFRQEFKNLEIQDIESYANYSLQNILDDLKHIQTLLDGSPTMKKLKDKKEFLLELTHKMLRQVQKDTTPVPTPNKKAIYETPKKDVKKNSGDIQLPIIRRSKAVPMSTSRVGQRGGMRASKVDYKPSSPKEQPKQEDPIQIIGIAPEEPKKDEVIIEKKRDSLIQPVEIAVEKEEPAPEIKPIEPVIEIPEVKEEQPEVKEEVEVKEEKVVEEPVQVPTEEAERKPRENKEIRIRKVTNKKRMSRSKDDHKRKKSMVLDGHEALSQIQEDEEGSDSENVDDKDGEIEKPKKKWVLTEDQEKQIQEMSAQYGVEVEALKNYLETKAAHNNFQWVGIKRLETKVDVNLEIKKLESEYERFRQRKHFRSLQLVMGNSTSSKTLPYIPQPFMSPQGHAKASAKNKFGISNLELHRNHTIFGTTPDWIVDEKTEEGSTNDDPSSRRKLASHKSLALTRGNSQQQLEWELRNFGNNAETKLHLQEEDWSDPRSAKSNGQFKLPSISSYNNFSKKIPTQTTINAVSMDLDDAMSIKRMDSNFSIGSNSLPNTDFNTVMVSPSFKGGIVARRAPTKAFPILAEQIPLSKMYSKESLDDSLALEIARDRTGSAQSNRREWKKPILSHMNTARSNYILSSTNVAKTDYVDSVVMDDLLKSTGSYIKTEVELKGRDEYNNTGADLARYSRGDAPEEKRSDKDDTNSSGEAVSVGLGATIQSITNKSMSTVYTQEAPSRLMSLRSIGSGMRVVEGDLEYYGNVKKLHLLGGGSQAKVFLCKVKEFEDLVALKQYDVIKNQQNNMQSYEALKNEFHMLRQLEHENVIKYHCLYKSRKKTYTNCVEFGVIMEYMPGGSLESYIESDFANISFENKKSLIKQILTGLDHLHKNHIIHRDLKPENILLSDDKSTAKITDFGISTQTSNDTNAQRSMVGTPWYMAPEVINEESYSSKADLWSAGCCFLHLITGKKPYHMANAIQAMLLMTNYKNPLETCDEETKKVLESHKGLKEMLGLCFLRDKNKRPSAGTLLKSPFFADA